MAYEKLNAKAKAYVNKYASSHDLSVEDAMKHKIVIDTVDMYQKGTENVCEIGYWR